MKRTVTLELKLIRQKIAKMNERLATIEVKYLDEEIDSATYQRLSKKYKDAMVTLMPEKEELEDKMEFMSQFSWTDCEHLEYIHATYSESDGYIKNKILKAVFPEGFCIDRKKGVLRTPFLNEIFSIKDSLSMDYKYIEIKSRRENESCPALGGRLDNLRTLYTDFLMLKAACG